ncbi:LPXTG cell wall anchor domain-containing protein [Brachybacterium squillarum]|uniref:LPXTG cell wall anchor domain-containing protein n=1 Tax=Brachybacterium squillarum TaxID=661979 RepID=UPI0039B66EB0
MGASPLTDDDSALGILLIGISVALLVLVAASVVRRRRRRSRTTRRAQSRC